MLELFPEMPLAERHTYTAGRTPPLVVMLGSVGRSRITSPSYDWHGLKRGRAEFALLQYTLAGRGALAVEGRTYSVTPGSAMLLTFPADNRYWWPEDSAGWEFFYLCLHGAEVMRIWSKAMKALGSLVRLPPEHEIIQLAARLAGDGIRGEITSPYAASARTYELLMALSAALSPEQLGANSAAESPHAAALERARRFGEEHFAEPLGVEDLARVAGLSRYYFTRLFTARIGAPPAAWLIDLRVKEAARLLRETSLTMKEICAKCGFTDPSYLGKVFRQRTGQPPQSYRHSGI